MRALRGQLLRLRGDPFLPPFAERPEDAIAFESDGAVVMDGGVIKAAGPAGEVLAGVPPEAVDHYPAGLILPGFIDAHVHYP